MNKKILQVKFIIPLLIIFILGSYFGYKKFFQKESEAHYILAKVEKGTLIASVSGSGNIISEEVAEINPGISGEVSEVKVKLGDKVKKGDLLLVIKNDSLEAQRAEAWTNYNQAKESLEKAKLEKLQAEEALDNLEEQKEKNPDKVSDLDIQIAKQRVRAAETAIKVAENRVWSAWLAYNKAREEASKRKVTSPIDGTVTALKVKVGDTLGASGVSKDIADSSKASTSLITIHNLEKLQASITLNEVDVAKVKVGQKATLTFDALPDLTLTGKVVEIETVGTVSQGIVSYGVKIALDSVDERIKPGMSVTAEIIVEAKPDVLTLPNSAIKSEGDLRYVQLIEAPEEIKKTLKIGSSIALPKEVKIKSQPVEVGISNDEKTEILSGVSEGDIIISSRITQQTQTSQTQFRFQIPGMGVPAIQRR